MYGCLTVLSIVQCKSTRQVMQRCRLMMSSSTLHFSTLIQTKTPATNPSLPLTKQNFKALLESHSSRPIQLKQIHALILTSGFSIKNSLLTRLLTSFSLLNDMSYAQQLFDQMHKPRQFLWNTLIKHYVRKELPDHATSIYCRMHGTGVRPDPFTFPFVIKACGEVADYWTGVAVHCHVLKWGFDFIAMVRTELVLMYVKFAELGSADWLFRTMAERDLVAWNAFIAVCVQCGNAVEAIGLYKQMGEEGVAPDSITVVGVLSACGQLGCLETGEDIYENAIRQGIDNNVILDNARLDMYSKCGDIEKARSIFEDMQCRSVVSWSTMIGGYAINGDSKMALTLFSTMKKQVVLPNYVTYLGVLSACSHAGLVSEGKALFNYMLQSKNENLKPRREHYACMVDLLSRSGHLEEACSFINSMPIEPDAGILGALLGACSIYNNVTLGEHVADMLFQLAPDIASYHVLLSNMYAAAGKWDKVDEVRRRMRRKAIKKVAAYSSVEIDGKVHILYQGDKSHQQSSSIDEKLDELLTQMKAAGYIPRISSVFHDVDVEEKEASLGTHSEKLAIVLSLINLRSPSPIRVIKNIRICDDCHTFSKFVSKITMREIIIRDKIRFHHFRNGVCSCKDFW